MKTEREQMETNRIAGDEYVGYVYLKNNEEDRRDYIEALDHLMEKQIEALCYEDFDTWTIMVPYKNINDDGDWTPTLH